MSSSASIVAAVVAVRYARQAAIETAKAAKAAADQVELQRPRPILLLTYSRSFKQSPPEEERLREFHLRNIGDSPAFDAEVGSLEMPDGSKVLTTDGLSYLSPTAVHSCRHRLEGEQGAIGILSPSETFADGLYDYFNKRSSGTLDESVQKRHEIQFTLSYRAIDKRHFQQRHAFVARFIKQRVWIEPLGSLLENTPDVRP